MRIIEIILKLAFLALSIFVIATKQIPGMYFTLLLAVSFVLGLVLIFNKKQSYKYPANWPRMKNVFWTRRIEGVILLAAAIFACVSMNS